MAMRKNSPTIRRVKHPIREGGVLVHLRQHIPAPTLEVALARILSKPGYFASMTDAEREFWATYDGPEIVGDTTKFRL